MRTYEFIDIELRKQAVEELKNNSSIKEQSKLIDVLETNSIGKELEIIDNYFAAIKQYDELNKLKNFTFILDLLKKVVMRQEYIHLCQSLPKWDSKLPSISSLYRQFIWA